LHLSANVVPIPTMELSHVELEFNVACTTAVISVRLSWEAMDEKAEEEEKRREKALQAWKDWEERK